MKTPNAPGTLRVTLCTWEENGYHDSDFYAAQWVEPPGGHGRVELVTTGTTRGYMPAPDPDAPPVIDAPLSPRILNGALEWLQGEVFARREAAEDRDVLTPEKVRQGDELRLVRAVRHQGRTWSIGTEGRVFYARAWGRFYRNGYNRPGRDNTRVGLELSSGERIFVALAACRRSHEPMPAVELARRAASCALHCQFGKALSSHHAWDSTNPARLLVERLGWSAEPPPAECTLRRFWFPEGEARALAVGGVA